DDVLGALEAFVRAGTAGADLRRGRHGPAFRLGCLHGRSANSFQDTTHNSRETRSREAKRTRNPGIRGIITATSGPNKEPARLRGSRLPKPVDQHVLADPLDHPVGQTPSLIQPCNPQTTDWGYGLGTAQ